MIEVCLRKCANYILLKTIPYKYSLLLIFPIVLDGYFQKYFYAKTIELSNILPPFDKSDFFPSYKCTSFEKLVDKKIVFGWWPGGNRNLLRHNNTNKHGSYDQYIIPFIVVKYIPKLIIFSIQFKKISLYSSYVIQFLL